jgi:hypothetical protein
MLIERVALKCRELFQNVLITKKETLCYVK